LEELMWKSAIGVTAALALAGSSLAIAQQSGTPAPSGSANTNNNPGAEQNWRPNAKDQAAFAAARAAAHIAELKAALQLTPDQEKNWPAFESALNELVKLRADRMAAFRERREQNGQNQPNESNQQSQPNEQNQPNQQNGGTNEQGPMNPFERLERRADTLSKFGAALKHLADAGMPLYQSLDDGQKHRFLFMARMMRAHWRMGEGMGHRGGWHGRGERGWGHGGTEYGRGEFNRGEYGRGEYGRGGGYGREFGRGEYGRGGDYGRGYGGNEYGRGFGRGEIGGQGGWFGYRNNNWRGGREGGPRDSE
jgi:hypothetical protein